MHSASLQIGASLLCARQTRVRVSLGSGSPGTFGLLPVGAPRPKNRLQREMVRRPPGFIRAQLNRIMWRELWIGVALGEAIALLGLCVYAYLHV